MTTARLGIERIAGRGLASGKYDGIDGCETWRWHTGLGVLSWRSASRRRTQALKVRQSRWKAVWRSCQYLTAWKLHPGCHFRISTSSSRRVSPQRR